MLQASKILPGGRGLAPALVLRAASLTLDWDLRQKSRFSATDSRGREIGVFLPRGTVLRGGDVLVAEDGSLIRIVAAPQPVLVITPCAEHGTPFDLTRAAYHLGNRHVPIELKPDHLKIECDHVLADMLRAMHLEVREAEEAFEPEAGAYSAHAGTHSHGGPRADAGAGGFRPFAPEHLDRMAARTASAPARDASGHGHGHGHGYGHGHAHGEGHEPSARSQGEPRSPAKGGGASERHDGGAHSH